jgi:hypothetical protein
MASNPEGFAYEVSVVVFYKRMLPNTPDDTSNVNLNDVALTERAVSASILSTGMNGGELLLTDMKDIVDSNNRTLNPFDNLKAGQWIMLCGPHPNSRYEPADPSKSEPRFVLNWYQVQSIDKTGSGLQNFDPNTQRVVAVRGPQWPWQPSTSAYTPTSNISNDLCVGIFRGAVAVHAKTVRLESPLGGSFGSGMSAVVPSGVSGIIGIP